ncbi:MAG: hypothetical protein A2857_06850 [Candidatus Levybacteria bacterium RIFCSPHIGHO2_01_FULL_36_15]|nr:MAG: hypothetical protein A2857_06850 [Candidatus Levybacteria bacterium RIFCSPHIGHO2_01_FULL_36_15]
MSLLISWVISGAAVLVTAYLLPGVHVKDFLTALIVALILGIINVTVKPVLLVLTLPINILTLGLFTLIINAAIILLVSAIVSNFKVDNFGWALLFSLVLSIINFFLQKIF